MDTVDEIDNLSRSELDGRIVAPLLRTQLARVACNSAFYREKLARAGVNPDDTAKVSSLENWPFTVKSEVLAEQAAHPPYGRLSPEFADRIVRVHMTSGTSGTPLYIALTASDVADNVVSGRRAFVCAGLSRRDTVVHCLNYCMWAGGLTDHLSLEATGATVIPFGTGHTKRLIETILNLKINCISSTPSYLSKIEQVLKEEFGKKPKELGLNKGLFGGEGGLQDPVVRKTIEDSWGIKAIDANYGMADVLSIFGAECDARAGLHFHGRGLLYAELINPDSGANIPLEAGREGELVLTNLTRQGQPVVRFRSGDVIRIVGDEPCRCGRASFRFLIVGRSDHMIVVRGVNVYATAIKSLLLAHREIFNGEFEMVLDTPPPINMPLLRVEVRDGASVSGLSPDRYLVDICRERLQFTPRVELLPAGTLPRTDGKTKYVRKTYTGA